MDFLGGLSGFVLPFLVILSVLVFVHELGHYWVARRCGVRVEVFSIGFGPELFGWTAKSGTRWKFSAIPLGGYVKMFGDMGVASQADREALEEYDEVDRREAFPLKSLGQRTAIVAAGPLANFLFAVVLLAGLFMLIGQPFSTPDVGEVQPESAAAAAGLEPGDRIVSIDGSTIERFEDIQRIVRLAPGETLDIGVERDGRRLDLQATPAVSETTDAFGNTQTIGLLGITRSGIDYVRHDPASALWRAVEETGSLTMGTLKAVGQIITGARSTSELGGPIRIAQMSGQVAETGIVAIIWFMAVLSINLGIINLVPIPMLDGGHLLFYGIEFVRGRPLGERAQDFGFRIGLALVLTLMVFVTWNDLVQLEVFEFLRGLVS